MYPERATLTTPSIRAEVLADDISFRGMINASINASQVTVDLDTDSKLSVVDLKNSLENFVNTMVDVYGYLKGYAYSVELDSVYIPETGASETFGIDVTTITNDEKSRPFNYQDILLIALKTPELYMVLKDLRDAIKRPHDTFFHCRRATETIAKYFTKSGNKKKGWEEAIKTLKLNEEDVNEIKKMGGDQRHGLYRSVEGGERVDIMMKTWKVVDKFVEYLKN